MEIILSATAVALLLNGYLLLFISKQLENTNKKLNEIEGKQK